MWIKLEKYPLTAFLKPEDYGEIANKYYERQNKSGPFSFGVKILTTTDPKTNEKADKVEAEFVRNYLENEIPYCELEKLCNFDYSGDEAQQVVYDLLWGFCERHDDIVMVQKINRHAPFCEQEEFQTLQYFDTCLSAAFGPVFYLVQVKKATQNMRPKNNYISAAFPIVVPEITEIRGRLESFIISFSDGYKMKLSDGANYVQGECSDSYLKKIYSSTITISIPYHPFGRKKE